MKRMIMGEDLSQKYLYCERFSRGLPSCSKLGTFHEHRLIGDIGIDELDHLREFL
jgi:hypothetical protein